MLSVPSSMLTVAYISEAVSPLSCLPTWCGISGKLRWLFCVEALRSNGNTMLMRQLRMKFSLISHLPNFFYLKLSYCIADCRWIGYTYLKFSRKYTRIIAQVTFHIISLSHLANKHILFMRV